MHDDKVELLYDTKDKLKDLRNLSTMQLVKAVNRISENIDCVIHDLSEEQIDAGGEDPREQAELT
tara:strand:- start:286 stop:480 length:195 start_codon:yes stop_codon:yes gene_type:complete